MGEALAEARNSPPPGRAADRRRRGRRRGDGRPGPRPRRARRTTRRPTPSSSPCARRPAGWAASRLADATIFTTLEPCAMCVGALLESDVEALVYAVPNDADGAAGTVIQLAQHPDAAAPPPGRQRHPPRRGRGAVRRRSRDRLSRPARTIVGWSRTSFGILSRGEVSEWLMVPLSKSGVRKHRGFESRPLRHHLVADGPAGLRPVQTCPGRGRLVDYGAALEMRFGATRRGFESRPLRHPTGLAWPALREIVSCIGDRRQAPC